MTDLDDTAETRALSARFGVSLATATRWLRRGKERSIARFLARREAEYGRHQKCDAWVGWGLDSKGFPMMVPKCDRCHAIDVQVVQVLGRDLCDGCVGAFHHWAGTIRKAAPSGLTIEHIQQAACDYYGVTIADLQSSSRRKSVAWPRMVAMYLCRNRLGASLREVGERFGGRDHTTTIHATRKVVAMVKSGDGKTVAAVGAILERLDGV